MSVIVIFTLESVSVELLVSAKTSKLFEIGATIVDVSKIIPKMKDVEFFKYFLLTSLFLFGKTKNIPIIDGKTNRSCIFWVLFESSIWCSKIFKNNEFNALTWISETNCWLINSIGILIPSKFESKSNFWKLFSLFESVLSKNSKSSKNLFSKPDLNFRL